jgi:hypothetical protein
MKTYISTTLLLLTLTLAYTWFTHPSSLLFVSIFTILVSLNYLFLLRIYLKHIRDKLMPGQIFLLYFFKMIIPVLLGIVCVQYDEKNVIVPLIYFILQFILFLIIVIRIKYEFNKSSVV